MRLETTSQTKTARRRKFTAFGKNREDSNPHWASILDYGLNTLLSHSTDDGSSNCKP